MSKFIVCAFLSLLFLASLACDKKNPTEPEDDIIFCDNFSGTVIDESKWIVFNGSGGGSLTQNEKIYWNWAGTNGHTGHGIRTVKSFQNGGVYVIEADYECDDITKQRGEMGTGINFSRINAERDHLYGKPVPSIWIFFWGDTYYQYNSEMGIKLTTKNKIPATLKPSGHSNDMFYYLGSKIVHLKIELNTDNRMIKCYANYADSTLFEAEFSSEIWNEILKGSNQFKIEEFRSWAESSYYMQHRLDNWCIKHIK